MFEIFIFWVIDEEFWFETSFSTSGLSSVLNFSLIHENYPFQSAVLIVYKWVRFSVSKGVIALMKSVYIFLVVPFCSVLEESWVSLVELRDAFLARRAVPRSPRPLGRERVFNPSYIRATLLRRFPVFSFRHIRVSLRVLLRLFSFTFRFGEKDLFNIHGSVFCTWPFFSRPSHSLFPFSVLPLRLRLFYAM